MVQLFCIVVKYVASRNYRCVSSGFILPGNSEFSHSVLLYSLLLIAFFFLKYIITNTNKSISEEFNFIVTVEVLSLRCFTITSEPLCTCTKNQMPLLHVFVCFCPARSGILVGHFQLLIQHWHHLKSAGSI